MDIKRGKEVATFAGGCFWCLQPLFDELRGVDSVEVGYTGGEVQDPTYEEVCSDRTGHAEAVQITFDPEVISYEELLGVFFSVHDPTTKNRQGADVGTQYRSAIFYHTPQQKAVTERIIGDLERSKAWGRPIVTEVVPLATFYRAEEYHQDYFRKNPWQGYCRVVIAPKVAKFHKGFGQRLKA